MTQCILLQEIGLTLKTFDPFTIQQQTLHTVPNYRYIIYTLHFIHSLNLSIALVPMVIGVQAVLNGERNQS